MLISFMIIGVFLSLSASVLLTSPVYLAYGVIFLVPYVVSTLTGKKSVDEKTKEEVENLKVEVATLKMRIGFHKDT